MKRTSQPIELLCLSGVSIGEIRAIYVVHARHIVSTSLECYRLAEVP